MFHSDVELYLKNGLSEVYPSVQQAVEVVPLLLQGSQILLQLAPGLLVPHGEQLSADLQSVDEAALMPLEQQLCALREKECVSCGSTGCSAVFKSPHLKC